VAVKALAALARDHDLVITHGNRPQVGLLANESSEDPNLPSPYSLDVLGTQTQGMIGYFLLQGFENALPGQPVASPICQTKVAADDPAFERSTKFVGPVYSETEGRRLARLSGLADRLAIGDYDDFGGLLATGDQHPARRQADNRTGEESRRRNRY